MRNAPRRHAGGIARAARPGLRDDPGWETQAAARAADRQLSRLAANRTRPPLCKTALVQV
jgi:hypothetical protein